MNTGIAYTLDQKAMDSKGAELMQRCARIIKHRSFRSFTSLDRAREIMGRNFFGVEEAIKHFSVTPSKQELAILADVPFSEKTLAECKYTHVLGAVFPLSILDIRRNRKVDRRLFFCRCFGTSHQDSTHEDTWLNEQAFAKDRGEAGWHLVRKTPVPDSTEKTWDEQQKLLGKDEETPNVRVVIYTMVGHYLSSGECRERLFENLPHVRCSDRLSPGRGVVVSNWSRGNQYALRSGIGCNSVSLNDRDSLAVASERKR